MKKITLITGLTLLLFSCQEEATTYLTFSGKISNVTEESKLTVYKGKEFERVISVNADGSFSDTLTLPEEGKYSFEYGNEYGSFYSKNGNTTSLSLNPEEFDESLTFEGDDANKSNFYIANLLLQEEHLSNDLFEKDEAGFEAVFTKLKEAYTELKTNSGLDTSFLNKEDADFAQLENGYKSFHKEKMEMLKELPAGKASPTFTYENYKGGTTSLSDFAGKYVYIDVWATWCGPCKAEIPSLKKLEADYHDKNIEFVSISVDDENGDFDKARGVWSTMVKEKELGGTQLFSDKGWQSEFVQAYKIKGIPRFILVDPAGNIVTPDAPRPSSAKLIELFNSLEI